MAQGQGRQRIGEIVATHHADLADFHQWVESLADPAFAVEFPQAKTVQLGLAESPTLTIP